MKIVFLLLFTILLVFCLACKQFLESRHLLAQRQMRAAPAPAQPVAAQIQAIATA